MKISSSPGRCLFVSLLLFFDITPLAFGKIYPPCQNISYIPDYSSQSISYSYVDPISGINNTLSWSVPAADERHLESVQNHQGILTWVARYKNAASTSYFYEVHYRIYDPGRGGWKTGSWGPFAGDGTWLDQHTVRDGVVAWRACRLAWRLGTYYTEWFVHYVTYDPNLGSWVLGTDATNTLDDAWYFPEVLRAKNGVVAWPVCNPGSGTTCADHGAEVVAQTYDMEIGRWVWGHHFSQAEFDWIEIAEDTAQVHIHSGNELRNFDQWLWYLPFQHGWDGNGYMDNRPGPVRRAYFVPGPSTGVVPFWTWFWDCSTAMDSPTSSYLWDLIPPGDLSSDRSPGFHFASPGTYQIRQYVDYSSEESYTSFGTVTAQLPEAPTGGIQINNGSGYTNSPNVTLSLHYGATATEMCFKHIPGLNVWTSWQPVAPSRTWTFTPLYVGEIPDGEQTIYVKFRDQYGTESQVYQASVLLDVTPPRGSLSLNGGAATTLDPNIQADWLATDPLGVDKMAWRAQNEEDNFYWAPIWVNYTPTTQNILFSSNPGRKTVVVQFKDFAGNISQVEASIRLLGPPAAFGKTLPANSATNVAANPTLSWAGSNGALSYELCYDPVNNGSCDSDWISVGANTSAALTGLSVSTTYYWQVRAINLDGTVSADNDTWWSFTTVPPTSSAFGKTIPGNSATNVPLNPSLYWSGSLGASKYEYCFDTSDDSTCSGRWLNAGTSTTALLNGLNPDTVYYWQVRASNAGGTTYANDGTWWRFMTVPVPPAPFSKSLPADSTANVPLSTTLSWAGASGANGYEYCYDTSNNDSCDGGWISVGTQTTAALIGLSPSTSYYWQVRAVNPGGTSAADSGAWWSFTTMAMPPPPATFGKSLPANGTTNVPVNPTLSWTGSSGATGYQYCYDMSNNDSCDSGWITAGTNTAAALIGLSINTTYYWQVRAINSDGSTYADGGTWWLFTTMGNPPPDITKTFPSNGATGISLNPNLTWTANSYATEYAYCFDTSNDNSCDGSWVSMGMSTSAALSGLSSNTTYYWQVRATIYGRAVHADNDTWWSFTTVKKRKGQTISQ